MRSYLFVMVLAAAITYLLVPVALKLALRMGAVSHVRARDVHTFPIARMGGVAMYGGFVVSLLVASRVPYLSKIFTLDSSAWGIIIGAGVMCIVGVIDDIYELRWYAKLAGEILAAGVMAWFGVQLISLPILGVTIGSARLNLFGTVVVVVLVANAVNFVDGLDGLAAGLVGIGGFAFFAYAYYLTRMIDPGDYTSVAAVVTAALVGVCAGFLPHNFHQARIFMGDSGALMLGAVVAGTAVVVTGQIDPANVQTASAIPAFMPILIPALILIVPLVDTFWAVLRRVLRGQSPFHADAGHLHHRLLRRGHSHTKAVLVLYMWAAVISFSGAASVIFPHPIVLICAVVLAVIAVCITIYQMRLPRVPGAQKHADLPQ
ncbi:MAG: undecaprenyl/decaprenyl-phosphate alpha-N-acetylglucosaminyl 1-phosphate transferase [Arcanobacterium sp.]|nr:undecaprenyl/decaprenyl-phosphate alpha-N-acetylglucosaminyl 1-phosphate transferase [Arcanobacterium sp.]